MRWCEAIFATLGLFRTENKLRAELVQSNRLIAFLCGRYLGCNGHIRCDGDGGRMALFSLGPMAFPLQRSHSVRRRWRSTSLVRPRAGGVLNGHNRCDG